MEKKKLVFNYLVAIPAFLYILLFKIVPLLLYFKLPFIAFSPSTGIYNSPWVGLQNFTDLFGQHGLSSAHGNTIILNLMFVLVCSVLAFILIWGLSAIKSVKLKEFFTTLFLIPLFIPSVIYTYIIFSLFSKFNFLSDSEFVRVFYIAAQTVKYCGIPVILGVYAFKKSEHGEFNRNSFYKPAILVLLTFAIIELSSLLTNDIEMVTLLGTGNAYQTMQVWDTYRGAAGSKGTYIYSVNSAKDLIKLVIQLAATVGAYVLIKKYFVKSIFAKEDNPENQAVVVNEQTSRFGYIPVILYSAFIISILFYIFIYPLLTLGLSVFDIGAISKNLPRLSFLKYLLIAVAAALLNMIITITAAYPLIFKKWPGRVFYKAVLITAISAGMYSMNDYLFYRYLGMDNNYWPILINGSFAAVNILVLKGIFINEYGDRPESEIYGKYLSAIIKPAVALGIIQFAVCWGSFYTPMLYLRNRALFSPVLIFREVIANVLQESSISLTANQKTLDSELVRRAVMQLAAVITFIPVAAFLLFRKLFTPEVFTGQLKK